MEDKLIEMLIHIRKFNMEAYKAIVNITEVIYEIEGEKHHEK
ncbi:Uncharacterised protein [Clostridioides difficile]|nr:hypothetical protein [Clostridioides difficile]EQK00008.1 hypothetical protein QUI_3963 [Clostridioides difficile P59]MDB6360937.1 hypothetical protein [Clostridioides difficile]MDE3595603.1 hypothetical protein [Clostridioides difficile]MDI0264803.1 hypothetical protein [Clostridioides difficile]MDI6057023.1 hypothetical protein [Clostridioides difficile]